MKQTILIRLLILVQLAKFIYCFESNEAVLSYISSGYLYKDPVQPNTLQLNYNDYFGRFTQFGINGVYLNLVNALEDDYDPTKYPNIDQITDETDPYQKIMINFYTKYSKVYNSYYKFDKISNSQQTVTFKIDPCKKIADKTKCIETSKDLTDNSRIQGGKDMLIAFQTDTIILHCSEEWQKLINCGTFIEIHRPFDPQIIEQIKMEEFLATSFKFFYFNTSKLCAGKYEIWYVVRTRIGVILQYTKPFFVTYPNCDCHYDLYLLKTIPCP